MKKLLNSEHLWQENNLNYINYSLNWLRSRLKYLIDPEAVTIEAVTIAQEKMREAATKEPLSAFITLSQKFGLTEFEQNLLLLAVARDLSPEFADLYAQAQREENLTDPTFHLAFALFDNPSWQVLAPDSPLRYWQLIEIHSSGRQSLLSSQFQASEQIVNYVRGYNHHQEPILAFIFPLHLPQISHPELFYIAPTQQQAIAKITNSLERPSLSTRLPLIQLLGPDTSTKQLIVQQVAQNFGLGVYRLLVEQLPTKTEELQMLIRCWSRESRLLNLALYLDLQGIEG
ncbi:MAG: ATP-binding protein, partial [Prochloraceae cyanobacterium]